MVAQLSADLLAAEERAASTMRMGTSITLPRSERPLKECESFFATDAAFEISHSQSLEQELEAARGQNETLKVEQSKLQQVCGHR